MFNHKHYVNIWQTQGKEKAEEYRESVTKVVPQLEKEEKEDQNETGEAWSGNEENTPPATWVEQTSKQDYMDILDKAGIQYNPEDSEDALKKICEANNLF